MPSSRLYNIVLQELTDFGSRPVEDAGKILNILQREGVSEREITDLQQRIYIRLFIESGRGDQNQARQSWVVASGNSFEGFVRNLVNQKLNQEGIFAIKGDRLRNSRSAEEVVNFLMLQARRRCTQTNTGVWPDSDVVVLTYDNSGRMKAFALLNCKTSDHSRNDAVLFWALALRDNNIKYCLVTQDLDGKFIRGDEQASSLRKKCEAYLDRVYTVHPLTVECSQVKKIDFTSDNGANSLLEDLRTWRRDVVPDFLDEVVDISSFV